MAVRDKDNLRFNLVCRNYCSKQLILREFYFIRPHCICDGFILTLASGKERLINLFKGNLSVKIKVQDSPIHGLGVFAIEDIAKGEVIEKCAYLVIDDDDVQEANRLNDYLYNSPDRVGDYLVMMGFGMLYNHGNPANAEWQIDDDNRFVCFTALDDISAGSEIVHDYGDEYWDTRKED